MIAILIHVDAKSKINKLDNCQILVTDNIIKLDISVSNWQPMKKGESIDNIFEDEFDLLFIKFSCFWQTLQRMWKIFQNEISFVILCKVVEIVNDVFMLYFFVEFILALFIVDNVTYFYCD